MDGVAIYRSILGAVCLAAIKQVDNYVSAGSPSCSSEHVSAIVVDSLRDHLDSRVALCPLTSPVTWAPPTPCPASVVVVEEVPDRQLAVFASVGSAVGTLLATRIWSCISRRRELVVEAGEGRYGVAQRSRRRSRIGGGGVLE